MLAGSSWSPRSRTSAGTSRSASVPCPMRRTPPSASSASSRWSRRTPSQETTGSMSTVPVRSTTPIEPPSSFRATASLGGDEPRPGQRQARALGIGRRRARRRPGRAAPGHGGVLVVEHAAAGEENKQPTRRDDASLCSTSPSARKPAAPPGHSAPGTPEIWTDCDQLAGAVARIARAVDLRPADELTRPRRRDP